MSKRLKMANALAYALDNQFSFLGVRFGLASLINLVPGFGDVLDALLSLYIVFLAVQLGVPAFKIFEMLKNIAVNFAIGAVPIIGDATYILRKVNLKNLKIINQYAPAI